MGLRTMTLGYGNAAVNAAAIEQIQRGSNFGRPSKIEMEAAQDLIDLIPAAEMVKFAKNGSTVTTAAIKLARAFTGREKVAFCKDHPFFSYDDWFIGTTPCDNGIPGTGKALSLPFAYNDLGSVKKIFAENPGEVACLIMEAATIAEPKEGFLRSIQEICRREGALFIIDEMITGFRWHLQGAQTYFGIEPDLSTFGKGIANGFSVSALVGRRDVMELGGIRHDKKRVFLISTTHGAENHSLAAMRAALRVYREEDVVCHLWDTGNKLVCGINDAAKAAGLQDYVRMVGFDCSPYIEFRDAAGENSLPFRTLFLQEMIRNGVMMNNITPCFAHTDTEVEITVNAATKALSTYSKAIEQGWEKYLHGPVVKPVFRPFN